MDSRFQPDGLPLPLLLRQTRLEMVMARGVPVKPLFQAGFRPSSAWLLLIRGKTESLPQSDQTALRRRIICSNQASVSVGENNPVGEDNAVSEDDPVGQDDPIGENDPISQDDAVGQNNAVGEDYAGAVYPHCPTA